MHDHDDDEECAICAAGGPSSEAFARYYDQIGELIKSHQQYLQGVGGDDKHLPFIYTIGNHERGLPELLSIGFYASNIALALNRLGHYMRQRGHAFKDGEIIDGNEIGFSVPFKIINTDARAQADYTFQVGQYYQISDADYQVQQVVLCDRNGKFPGDEGCEEPFASLPVLKTYLN